jgi:hypothetical protein
VSWWITQRLGGAHESKLNLESVSPIKKTGMRRVAQTKNPACAGFLSAERNAQAAEAAFLAALAFLALAFFSAFMGFSAFISLAAGAAAGAEAAWAKAPKEKVAAISAAMILFMVVSFAKG